MREHHPPRLHSLGFVTGLLGAIDRSKPLVLVPNSCNCPLSFAVLGYAARSHCLLFLHLAPFVLAAFACCLLQKVSNFVRAACRRTSLAQCRLVAQVSCNPQNCCGSKPKRAAQERKVSPLLKALVQHASLPCRQGRLRGAAVGQSAAEKVPVAERAVHPQVKPKQLFLAVNTRHCAAQAAV